jgi:hypothetical protein
MPLQATSGAASYDAFGGGAPAAAPNYIEEVFSTWLYTGNGSSQEINNGIAFVDPYGGSGYFNNGLAYLVPNSSSIVNFGTGDFTVEFWVKAATPAVSYNFFDGRSTSGQNAITIGILSTNEIVFLNANGTVRISAAGFIPNTWNHIAVTRSGTSTRLFCNGSQIGSTYTDSSTYISGTNRPTIGASGFAVGVGGLIGYSSNVRVVKGTAVYTGSYTVPTAPLTAISGTSLLTCQANGFVDASPNAYTITNNGAVAISSFGPFINYAASKGGMVWIKGRSGATANALYDTNRGATKDLVSNSSLAETTQATGLTEFTSSGFVIGSLAKLNTSAATYASWTFLQQSNFFDVVTYTGTGANRTVPHNLGSVPGCIIVKRTDATGDWQAYHRSNANTQYMVLNSTAAAATGTTRWNSTTPTSTEFSLGTDATVNASGGTYVAYIYAHDAGGFGLTNTDNVISCGGYTGNGSATGPVISLGYEPQWLMIKNASGVGNWNIIDNMRGMPVGAADFYLEANTADAETSLELFSPTSTGFQITSTSSEVNTSGSNYIYMAIRRGPMKVPTDGTSVFAPVATGSTLSPTGGFPLDLWWFKARNGVETHVIMDRLRWPNLYLESQTTAADASNPAGYYDIDNMTGGVGGLGSFSQYIHWLFRRAPSFFDMVCYTGTGSNSTISHNLTSAPELMIVKGRSGATAWQVYSSGLANTEYLVLNTTAAKATGATRWNSTTPTSTVFSLGTAAEVNTSAATYVAYLFATCPGVSKVGSYTGTGATQTIDCGFTGGARFVLIKRTDATGDWYMWDTERGMVSGTDPSLLSNSTAAEVNANSIYTTTGGFQIVSTAAGINASGGGYIFLSVA